MDFTKALTEPMHSLVSFHNQFNKRIKFSFGALARIKEEGAKLNGTPLHLPVGEEPWNQTRTWRQVGAEADLSLQLITEMGLARAATAFEEYVIGSIAELDRGDGDTKSVEGYGNLSRLINRLGVSAPTLSAQLVIVEFYDCARNCIVHRSGRANKELAERAASPELKDAVSASARSSAKWKPTIPQVVAGEQIVLQPRHAIMASGAYHKLASMLDKALVQKLGKKGFVRMAGYWSLLSDYPIPTSAKLNPQIVVRSLLVGRYCVKNVTPADISGTLRQIGKWDEVRKAFEKRYGADSKHSSGGKGNLSPTRS